MNENKFKGKSGEKTALKSQKAFSTKFNDNGEKRVLTKEELAEKRKKEEDEKKTLLQQVAHSEFEGITEGDNRDDLANLYFDSFEVDDKLFTEQLELFTPKPKSRTYEELRSEAIAAYESSLKTMQFGVVASESLVTSGKSEDVQETVVFEVDKRELTNTLFDFAFIYGNYNENKKWIKLLASNRCVAFPELISSNKHAAFVTIFAKKISEKLEKHDNALISILKRKNVEIKKEKRKFLFAKGHLLCEDDESRNKCIKDLNLIFEQVKLKQDKRDFSKLRFFTD